ncbi:MAG TPA: glutamate racemase [Acidimicrobiia bacterium]
MIGVFDSGVGGLSVLGEIRRQLPAADLLYLADRANSPYGERELAEVRGLAEACVQHLLGQGAELIVVACNTASAAALGHLRSLHPQVAFVGMEPAVKPAVAITRSGVIGVVATTATFQGELFASLIGRLGGEVVVIAQACPGWAEAVEAGKIDSAGTRRLVAEALAPVLRRGADTLVLGCTHYPFLRATIEQLAGPQLAIIDPAPAVARQVARLYPSRPGMGTLRISTTGDAVTFGTVARQLAGVDGPVAAVTLGP